jgi:hypothetical protein
LTLQITNNTPSVAVLSQARVHYGQAVEFAPPQLTTWVPNKIYQLGQSSGKAALIITQGTRTALDGEKIPINITMVVGENQFREENVVIPKFPAARDLVNAWWLIIIIHLPGLAPEGWLASPDNRA